jgi:hypothetical protein
VLWLWLISIYFSCTCIQRYDAFSRLLYPFLSTITAGTQKRIAEAGTRRNILSFFFFFLNVTTQFKFEIITNGYTCVNRLVQRVTRYEVSNGKYFGKYSFFFISIFFFRFIVREHIKNKLSHIYFHREYNGL